MSKGARRAEMYDIDERSTQGTSGARQQIENDDEIRKRGAAAQPLAQQMSEAPVNGVQRPAGTLRNADLANAGSFDVEGNREAAARGANRDSDDMEYGRGKNPGNSNAEDPVNKEHPTGESRSFWDYLFNNNPGRGSRNYQMGTH
jgi:hypothetical protein